MLSALGKRRWASPTGGAKDRHNAMTQKNLFVERRPQGDYAVRKPNAERASAVAPTQAQAIAIAREMHPGHSPDVERVRRTSIGRPDKWRKV